MRRGIDGGSERGFREEDGHSTVARATAAAVQDRVIDRHRLDGAIEPRQRAARFLDRNDAALTEVRRELSKLGLLSILAHGEETASVPGDVA